MCESGNIAKESNLPEVNFKSPSRKKEEYSHGKKGVIQSQNKLISKLKMQLEKEKENSLFIKHKVVNKLKRELEFEKKENRKLRNDMGKIKYESTNMFMKLTDVVMDNKKLTEKLSMIKKIGMAYDMRFRLIRDLTSKFNEYSIMATGKTLDNAVFGSFVRNIFELPFAIKDVFKYGSYGNPIGRDIDMALYSSFPAISGTEGAHSILEGMGKIINKYHEKGEDYYIGDFKVCSIKICTIDKASINKFSSIGIKAMAGIPHCKMTLSHNNNEYKVDVMGWIPSGENWDNSDFDINQMLISRDGILSNNFDTNFIDVIDSIRKRSAYAKIDLQDLHNKALCGESSYKVEITDSILSQIAFFICERYKIFLSGYKIVGNLLKIRINTTDDCFITACKPPYIEVHLECDHWISIMMLFSMIHKKSEFSNALKCPYCRERLKISFDKENDRIMEIDETENCYREIENKKDAYLSDQSIELMKHMRATSCLKQQTNEWEGPTGEWGDAPQPPLTTYYWN